MKKVLGSIALLATVVLAGCSNGSTAQGDGKTLEVFSQKPEMQAQLAEIVENFNKEFDAQVELVAVPDAGTVLKTRIANGEAPDVINIYPQNADFQMWAQDGQFLDLTQEEFMTRLKSGSAEQYAVDDKLYSLPLTTNAWGFFYNEDMFNELGLEVPETFAEFETLVADIQAAGYVPFAGSFSTADSWSLNGYHQLAWAQNAGGFEGANDYLRFSPVDAISGDDAVTQAVAQQLDLLKSTAQTNANGASYADAVATFAKGEALILPQGIWALPAINEQNPEFTVKTFAYPGNEANQQLTVGAADLAFSISESSPNKELALQFLEYISRPEVLKIYAEVDGMPTSLAQLDEEIVIEATQGITQYAFTDQQIVWLQKDWDSEEGFWHLTVDYINGQGTTSETLAAKLNEFFNGMK